LIPLLRGSLSGFRGKGAALKREVSGALVDELRRLAGAAVGGRIDELVPRPSVAQLDT
jgi:hypothetical protein